jgi:hypothetical protein
MTGDESRCCEGQEAFGIPDAIHSPGCPVAARLMGILEDRFPGCGRRFDTAVADYEALAGREAEFGDTGRDGESG